MENLTIEHVREFLKRTDLNLKPTQQKISFPVIKRIHRRLKEGQQFSEIEVYDNQLLIDGHHRYVSNLLLGNKPLERPQIKAFATTELEWSEIIVTEKDFDTEDKKMAFEKKYDSKTSTTLVKSIQLD